MLDLSFSQEFVKKNFLHSEIELEKNAFVFTENEKNEYVYFIENGIVDIFKNNILIGITKDGEFIGITSCLSDGEEYSFTAKCKKKSKIIRISKDNFKKVIEKDKKFCDYMMKTLCERIKITDLKTKSFLEKTYEKRLVFEIITHSIFDGTIRKVSISIDELNKLTGIPKKIIQTIISNFVSDKVLLKKRSEIIIINMDKLQSSL